MHPLQDFSVDDLVEASAVLRQIGAGASTMVEVAQRITDDLYVRFTGEDGDPGCLAVRLYKTHRVDRLPEDLAALARVAAGANVEGTTRALVLMARTDDEQVMPAPDPAALARPLTPELLAEGGPMLEMLAGLGLDVDAVVDPDAVKERQLHRLTYNTFLQADVLQSGWIDDASRPIVEQMGLRSMVAVGGALMSGEVFFVVLFTRHTVPERTADLLRSLAPAVQAALTPFLIYRVFTPAPSGAGVKPDLST